LNSDDEDEDIDYEEGDDEDGEDAEDSSPGSASHVDEDEDEEEDDHALRELLSASSYRLVNGARTKRSAGIRNSGSGPSLEHSDETVSRAPSRIQSQRLREETLARARIFSDFRREREMYSGQWWSNESEVDTDASSLAGVGARGDRRFEVRGGRAGRDVLEFVVS
jgi:hypothetical protein